MMTMRDRNRLRRLQDRIITGCERIGAHDNDIAILSDGTTLGNIRRFLYPQLESEMRSLAREFAGR